MKTVSFTSTALIAAFIITAAAPAFSNDNPHRIGVGANYWTAIDDIDTDNLDDNGLSYYVSYQYWPSLIGVEAAYEWLPDHIGDDAMAPQAYIILGSGIYAAAGIGALYIDGEFLDDPFYAFKAGLNLELLPSLYVDISACYRFSERSDLKNDETDIDTDTVFLGGAVRLAF